MKNGQNGNGIMSSQMKDTTKKHKLQITQIETDRQKVMFDAICFFAPFIKKASTKNELCRDLNKN